MIVGVLRATSQEMLFGPNCEGLEDANKLKQVSHLCFQNRTHWKGLGFNFLASCFPSIDPSVKKCIASVAFNFPTLVCITSQASGLVNFLVGLAQECLPYYQLQL